MTDTYYNQPFDVWLARLAVAARSDDPRGNYSDLLDDAAEDLARQDPRLGDPYTYVAGLDDDDLYDAEDRVAAHGADYPDALAHVARTAEAALYYHHHLALVAAVMHATERTDR